jgi:hypothetical protein
VDESQGSGRRGAGRQPRRDGRPLFRSPNPLGCASDEVRRAAPRAPFRRPQDKRVRLYDTAPAGTSAAARSSSDQLESLDRYGSGLSSSGGAFGSRDSGGGSSFGGGGGGAAPFSSRDSGGGGGRRSGGSGSGGGAPHRAGGWRLRKDVTTRMTRWTITGGPPAPHRRAKPVLGFLAKGPPPAKGRWPPLAPLGLRPPPPCPWARLGRGWPLSWAVARCVGFGEVRHAWRATAPH